MAAGRIQPQKAGLGRGQMQAAEMGGVVGIQQQGLIAGIQHRQGEMGRALLGAQQQQHLPLGINTNAEATLGPGGHRLAQGQGAAMQAVGGAFGGADPIADRGQHRLRRLQIGGAERQVEQRGQTSGRC